MAIYMTPYQFWLAEQSDEFLRGYDDACLTLKRDKTQSKEYLRGFDKAQDDMAQNDHA